jgi:hypothetical protein
MEGENTTNCAECAECADRVDCAECADRVDCANTADCANTPVDEAVEQREHEKMIEESEKLVPEVVTDAEKKIRTAAGAKYSKEEIDGIIKMGKIMASKAVLSMLVSVIEEGPARGLDSAECKKLVELVRARMPYDYSGFLQCEFAEIEFKLNISLTLAERGYQAEISVPDAKYAGDLYKQYNFLKSVAVAYWQQFVEDYNALYKRVCQYRNDVNFSELVVDQASPTTLYFDPNSKMRVGLLPYYTDASGRPLRKK